MSKDLRIKANVGEDQILHLNMKQDVDLFEILSLTLSQRDAYRIHSSNYGVVIGRVLANDAFGVPNAKISVFVPLTYEDSSDNDITSIYPFNSVTDRNSSGLRYNLLPTYSNDECYTKVGTFPSKRLVLDEDKVLEIYDKYYKYTTTTNKAGDYMIFGIPTGNTRIHVDVDLSDIGMLSQRPRDFVSKGYNINQFDSPTKFKNGTNLDNLAQLFSQDETISVYPFWGDSEATEAAITRKDINLQYQFETSCVFLGSCITDSNDNDISHQGDVEAEAGEAYQLSTGEGTIEMIRKTPYGNVEEYSIQGNQLINSDGVWCYQIPMNLDYVGMDELGNIVPTNDPTKGIPTRTRVRFRISMSESGSNTLTRHKAKYLVPNNPMTRSDENNLPELYGDSDKYFDDFYIFGTETPECCFRDLMWNNVYTVKSFIPRFQKGNYPNIDFYSGIKGVNKKGASSKNTFPYNKIKLKLPVNSFDSVYNKVTDNTNGMSKENFWKAVVNKTNEYNVDAVLEDVIDETDGISLEFYNDWVNGVLYFPLWFWRVRKKSKYKKGQIVYDSKFCSYDEKANSLYTMSTCELPYLIDTKDIFHKLKLDIDKGEYDIPPVNVVKTGHGGFFGWGHSRYAFDIYGYDRNGIENKLDKGIIVPKTNKDGLNVYYYCSSQKHTTDTEYSQAVDGGFNRLFSTDIVLLGSLSDNDINGTPKISDIYPITSANIPPMGTFKGSYDNDGYGGDNAEFDKITGMHWGLTETDEIKNEGPFKVSRGLFFGTYWFKRKKSHLLAAYSLPKTCINVERICELGVSLDMSTASSIGNEQTVGKFGVADGLITKREIGDDYGRQLFATLNQYPLMVSKENVNSVTGYYNYPFMYSCPTDFNGIMSGFIGDFTKYHSFDDESRDYESFRFGGYGEYKFNVYQYKENDKNKKQYFFPAYDNSFYFYFGLHGGTTAIEEFRKQYYAECAVEDSMPFNVSVMILKTPTVCDGNGKIRLNTTSFFGTYDNGCMIYKITDSSGAVFKEDKVYKKGGSEIVGDEVSGVPQGRYSILISGYTSCDESSENGYLGQIEVTFEVSMLPISAAYETTAPDSASGTGSLNITSITLYGKTYETTSDNCKADGNKITIKNGDVTYEVIVEMRKEDNDAADAAFKYPKFTNLSNDKTYTLYVREYCGGTRTENAWSSTIKTKYVETEEEDTEEGTTTE